MPTISFDGLASGLDTSSLVTQLLQAERTPQVQLQNRRAGVDESVAAYQAVNSLFAGLKTAASAITAPDAWRAVKAVSSLPTAVSATATSGATAGSLTFTVDRLATAGAVVSTGTTGSLAAVVAGPVVAVTKGTTTNVDVGGGTLSEVADALNAANLGLTATTVQTSPGVYKLQLASTTTGAASALSVNLNNATLGSMATLTAAQDARITVGTGPAAYAVTSATNTIAGVVPGVTFGLLATSAAPVTVSVNPDGEAVADKVGKLVEAANAALKEIKAKAGYSTATKTGGVLLGDSVTRSLEQQVLQTVSNLANSSTTGTSLAPVGVSLTREGTVVFDRATFSEAFATAGAPPVAGSSPDPLGALTKLAERLAAVATGATDTATGSLTLAVKGLQTKTRSLDETIGRWDVRLEQRERTLRRQFSALETALSSMKSQSSWLAGQLANLG